ncbi:hypothetical protein VTK73DRAFT_6579 [Phialemonium thermophilum]|uniref:Uncharacterized protein n=1 Tax=Phialemonium thermophilum TaxID=223376 RepID=A0ABR3WIS9_9PEZI
MGRRRSQLDSEEEMLPPGFKRIGYDADTQTYFYSDDNGATWEGSPGSRYGTLRRVSTRAAPLRQMPAGSSATVPHVQSAASTTRPRFSANITAVPQNPHHPDIEETLARRRAHQASISTVRTSNILHTDQQSDAISPQVADAYLSSKPLPSLPQQNDAPSASRQAELSPLAPGPTTAQNPTSFGNGNTISQGSRRRSFLNTLFARLGRRVTNSGALGRGRAETTITPPAVRKPLRRWESSA